MADAFKDQLEEDLSETFFNAEEFASTIQIKQGSAAAYSIPVIFDDEYESVDPETQRPIISTQPNIRLHNTDLHQALSPSDVFTIDAVNYRPVTNEPDGVGTTRVTLNKIP